VNNLLENIHDEVVIYFKIRTTCQFEPDKSLK